MHKYFVQIAQKIIALLLVAVSLFAFASCKKEPVNTDPVAGANEFASNQAAVEAEYSKQAAEKAEKEEDCYFKRKISLTYENDKLLERYSELKEDILRLTK